MTGHVGEQDYQPFPGLVLTDTFQSYEDGDRLDYEVFRDNNARLEAQKALPITVIVGNPPYSTGQDIGERRQPEREFTPRWTPPSAPTYRQSDGDGQNSLYDSYIRAIKWATLRLTGEASSAS